MACLISRARDMVQIASFGRALLIHLEIREDDLGASGEGLHPRFCGNGRNAYPTEFRGI